MIIFYFVINLIVKVIGFFQYSYDVFQSIFGTELTGTVG